MDIARIPVSKRLFTRVAALSAALAALTVTVAPTTSKPAASTPKKINVDSFSAGVPGQLPIGWQGEPDEAGRYYRLKIGPGNNSYLAVNNDKTKSYIIKRLKVDLVKYPYLNWKWRVNRLPQGASEAESETFDVGASVTVVLVASRWRPKTIKYSWSSSLAVGKVLESPNAWWPARADIIVMQSGAANKGKWLSEKRNVLADYKKLYEEKQVDTLPIDAIMIMSDGNDTGSRVSADYDDLYFSAE